MVAILISFLIAWTGATQNGPQQENYCVVDNAVAPHSGRIIRVRGSVSRVHGTLYLNSTACNKPLILVYPDEVKPKPDFQLQKDKEYKRFDKAVYDFKKGTLELRSEIAATFEGRLDWAYQRDSKGNLIHGTSEFGHLGAESWRLVVKNISQVDVRRRE